MLKCEVERPHGRVWLAVWLAVLLVPATLVLGALIGPGLMCHDPSKAELARFAARRYAHEGYPSWLATHPGQTCPRALRELDEYTGGSADRDPWGRPFVMICSDHGLVVVSLGENGVTSSE
ncbi:MAG TPA: hypothetical protein VLX92_07330 [Kofleriaceae bacterium]|nr:hypothetical protein [Kofleriaceae bacterium]